MPRRPRPPRPAPANNNVIPFPMQQPGMSGAELADEAHRERCRDGYVTEQTQLGPVRSPCSRCRPGEVRVYHVGRSRMTADWDGPSTQVWYPHLREGQ